jgi:hypothetical protein
MPSAGFEPAIPATKRPQTYALDRATTEIDQWLINYTSIHLDISNYLRCFIDTTFRELTVRLPTLSFSLVLLQYSKVAGVVLDSNS